MFIDTHFHLSKEDYNDIDSIVKNAKNNELLYLIISGCDRESIIEGIDYTTKYNNVYMTIGFHPEVCDKVDDNDLKWLEEIINKYNKIIGIGEIGLDYHYSKDNKVKQLELFEKQLVLAQKLNIPVVIHSRDAFKDTYDMLKKYQNRGIIHCFTSNIENARAFISLGYYLGIGGVLTFKNSHLKEVISKVDINNIVLETDSPYLSPEPYRGKINEPKNIPIIAKRIADIKNMNIEEVGRTTTSSVLRLFDLNM